MTTEQVTVLFGILSTGISGIIGVLMALARRDMGRLQVRLAEVEAKRENARADDANMAIALQLATHLATTLSPLRESIDRLTSASEGVVEKSRVMFEDTAKTMSAVTARRDQERQEDREFRDRQQGEILERLDRQQKQLEDLTKEVKVSDLPASLRGEISKLVLLASNIGADVKSVLSEFRKQAQTPDPGDVRKDPEPEKSEEVKEEKHS
jgi:hypothetical protein